MAGSGKAHLHEADSSLLRVEDLVVEFPVGRTGLKVNAVSGISFDVLPGETLGLVGESGCGKSTTGRAIMQLPRPTSGSIRFNGNELTSLASDKMREARTSIQMIFQDPISSLNPRRKVRDIVMEPLNIWNVGTKAERQAKVDRTLEEVGIDPQRAADSQPHQFSGGQCQRISIARALVLDPKMIICDEPVSALDVSVQAQVLNLLEDLKASHHLTLIFIAHDLAVVKNVSDRVAVMYLGKVCEVAPADDLYRHPRHPYTEVLLSSIPEPDPSIQATARKRIAGEPPSPVLPPSGCRFRDALPLRPGALRGRGTPAPTDRGRALRRLPLPPRVHRLIRRPMTTVDPDLVEHRPVRRRRMERGERQEAILAAAMRVFALADASSVNVDLVAAEAGVSRALVYEYFGDRSNLVSEVRRRFVREFVAGLEAAVASASAAHDLLVAFVRAHLGFATRGVGAYRLATEDPSAGVAWLGAYFGGTPEALLIATAGRAGAARLRHPLGC